MDSSSPDSIFALHVGSFMYSSDWWPWPLHQETYRFDPERIAVMGDSAGGNLAAMIATVDEPGRYLEACPHTLPSSEWIDGAVLFYPPTDFTSTEGHRPVDVGQALEPYFDEAYDMIPAERLAEASPIRWVDGSEPPVLLVQGDADSIAPPWTVEKFADALDQAGVTVDMALIEGAGHGFIVEKLTSPEMTQSLAAIEPFLAALLVE